MSPSSVLALAKEKKAQMVDFKFIDLPGIWQHFSVPLSELTESSFEEGFGFDGSSIRGWPPIHASDMLIKPDPITAVIDPFMEVPSLSIACTILDPMTGQPYSRDPRYIVQKAEKFFQSTGVGDV